MSEVKPTRMVLGDQVREVTDPERMAALERQGWRNADVPTAPWEGYDDMTIEQVRSQIDNVLSSRERRKLTEGVIAYENSRKSPRKSLVEGLGGTVTAQAASEEQPPITVETVEVKPLKTIETVEIIEADEMPRRKRGVPRGDTGE